MQWNAAGQSQLDAELEALRAYCKADIERLYPTVEPGGSRIKACLMANKEQMSVGCAQTLIKLKEMKKKDAWAKFRAQGQPCALFKSSPR